MSIKISMQIFGGRGGSWKSGAISADGVILKGDSMHVERLTGSSFYSSSPQIALEAVTDGKGNLTLKWASESGYREQNSKSTYAQYDIKAGITNLHPQGKHTVDLVSVNINWNKVKTVSGKTYGTQKLMREQGFKWDGAKKIWTR